MAKAKSLGDARKVSFGVRKKGAAKKAYNKHTPRPKKYQGQGFGLDAWNSAINYLFKVKIINYYKSFYSY